MAFAGEGGHSPRGRGGRERLGELRELARDGQRAAGRARHRHGCAAPRGGLPHGAYGPRILYILMSCVDMYEFRTVRGPPCMVGNQIEDKGHVVYAELCDM